MRIARQPARRQEKSQAQRWNSWLPQLLWTSRCGIVSNWHGRSSSRLFSRKSRFSDQVMEDAMRNSWWIVRPHSLIAGILLLTPGGPLLGSEESAETALPYVRADCAGFVSIRVSKVFAK